jgi:uncharacterized SAM-binding protein YcdF (DUF218 family)
MSDRPRRTRWRRRLIRWGILVGILTSLFLTRGWTLPAWGRWLDVSESPRPADYAYVLGGGTDSRPFVAAGLYKRGLVGTVLVPQTRPSPEAEDRVLLDDTEVVRRVLVARGVPADRVMTLPGVVNSTFDEAHALARFLDDHPDATVAAVTHDFHTRRARSVFRKALGPRAGQVYFVATPLDRASADTWWHTETGFVTYLGETFKAGYYAVRY